ncbi:MAG: hypothetical protein GY940_42705 [bacterium]|nr:hypothetical protein [bacterium]
MKTFLDAFIHDDEALLNYFKLYFLDTFSMSDHYKEIASKIKALEEKDLMASVTQRISPEIEAYISGLFDPNSSNSVELSDNLRVAARDFFYNQFGNISVKKADFNEIE